MELRRIGSVHGRLQPFHNGHLDYFKQAIARSDYLFVGVTQIFRPISSATTDRDGEESNPLTYLQRKLLVEASLADIGLSRSRFEITPFPIEQPSRLYEFIPIDAVCYTTVVTPWNDEKIIRLQAHGFKVETLQISVPDNVRVTSGTEIRRLIRANDPSWARFVPPVVGELIAERMMDSFRRN